MWLALGLILALTALSVYGAFIGAEQAKELFNSLPMQMFWFLVAVALLASLVLFPSLIKRPSLLLIHLGCVAILAGSIWASETGHAMQKRLFGSDKLRCGRMLVYEHHKINQVLMSGHHGLFQLPFEIGLDGFRIDYYDSPSAGGQQTPKEFFSDISVIENDRVVRKQTIEVNKPLHYGGYYFYQQSFDQKDGKYTILSVVSDNGLYTVFAGYALLTAGLFGRCWLAPAVRLLRKK